MEFLGKLGIDANLLVAQIVNFGLLLWILNRFLYRPIVRRIEKDEAELERVQTQKAELEKEKIAFAERAAREMSGAKKKIREIVKEAERIAGGIKKEAREKAEVEEEAIIRQSKRKLESLKPEIEKEALEGARAKMGDSFKKAFEEAFAPPFRKSFQDVFWEDLIGKIEKLEMKKLGGAKLPEVLKKAKAEAKKKGEKRSALEKELEKIFIQKTGPVILEYALPLEKEKEGRLEEIVSEKIGIKIKPDKKQNKNLVSGFRFEIAGTVIESNLAGVIDDAADFSSR